MKSQMGRYTHTYLIVSGFTLVVLVYLVMALYFPMAYIWATYEDLFGEWSQTFFFLAALILSLRNAFSKSQNRCFFAVM